VNIFYVTSATRKNGKITAISAIQHKAIPPVRLYMEITHVYHGAMLPDPYIFLVPYVINEVSFDVSVFRLKVGKKDEEYFIVEPDDEKQCQALISLPEYVKAPMDFT